MYKPQWANVLPIGGGPKVYSRKEPVIILYYYYDEKFGDGLQKNKFRPNTAFVATKKAILGYQGHKTAWQAAEWAPTGKPKVSRVTSGYGDVMILLSRVRLRPKKVCYVGEV